MLGTRTQSAARKALLAARTRKQAAPRQTDEVEEMLLAELAARRARLREILDLVRLEVAREMESAAPAVARRGCRQSTVLRGRGAA